MRAGKVKQEPTLYREGPPYQRRGSLQLWQFLVTLLDDPANAHFIAWTGRGMEFKLIEPEEVRGLSHPGVRCGRARAGPWGEPGGMGEARSFPPNTAGEARTWSKTRVLLSGQLLGARGKRQALVRAKSGGNLPLISSAASRCVLRSWWSPSLVAPPLCCPWGAQPRRPPGPLRCFSPRRGGGSVLARGCAGAVRLRRRVTQRKKLFGQ